MGGGVLKAVILEINNKNAESPPPPSIYLLLFNELQCNLVGLVIGW